VNNWLEVFKLFLTCLLIINSLAWAVSEFKYNVIFLTQLVLVVVYLAVYHAALIPYALVLTSAIILILPNDAKQRFRRRSRRRSSSRSSGSSRSRSKKTTTQANSPEASITES
jgi:hypothetical protein